MYNSNSQWLVALSFFVFFVWSSEEKKIKRKTKREIKEKIKGEMYVCLYV